MSDEAVIIHREAKYGHALCGEEAPISEMTLDDDQVTCQACQDILEQIRCSNTKTKLLKRFFHEDDEE